MPAPRFDSVALFRALDAVRRERGVSWQRLAAEAGVAASTLKRAQLGGPMEADGVLAMVRLVGRVPEDFAPGASVAAGPLKPGRFDTQALHAALETRRRELGLGWPEVSREVGAGDGGALRRLVKGGRVNADLMLACTWWLGRHVNDFVDPDFEHPGELRRRLVRSHD